MQVSPWANLPAAEPILGELVELGRLIPTPPPSGHPGRDACTMLAAAMGHPVHGPRVRELLAMLSEALCPPPPAADRGGEIAALLDQYADILAAQQNPERDT